MRCAGREGAGGDMCAFVRRCVGRVCAGVRCAGRVWTGGDVRRCASGEGV